MYVGYVLLYGLAIINYDHFSIALEYTCKGPTIWSLEVHLNPVYLFIH